MNVNEVLQGAYLEHLYPAGINEPPRDVLAEAITDDADTMTTEQLQGFFPQGPIEFDDTGELAITKEAEATADVDLLVRGYRGTTAADHAAGTVIFLGPPFPKVSAFGALKKIISQLPAWGVYRRMSITDVTVDLTGPVELPADCTRVVDVAYRDPLYWQPLDNGKDFWFFPDLAVPTIQFLRGYQGAETNIVYAADFTSLTTLDENEDLTEDVGIPAGLQEHLSLGVAAKLLMSRESPRVQLEAIMALEDDQRIPPGAMTAVGQTMWKEFLGHVASERRRLHELQRSTQVYKR